ncbi:MAG: Uma2 family endonuclease, partial [Chloroflexota bacterium]
MLNPTGTRLITLDELEQMGDARVEIVDGELVEMTAASGIHHIVVSNIDFILQSYVREKRIGSVFPDGLTYLMGSPAGGLKNSFIPDVSFIRTEDISADWDINRPNPGVPTLAVEVVSPTDIAETVKQKARTYLDSGTEQVWIVYPQTQEVEQYISGKDGVIHVYKSGEVMDVSAL